MPRGGKRAGAGAKPGNQNGMCVDKAKYRQAARDVIGPHMVDVLAAHIKNAMGISYLVRRDKATGKFVRVGALAVPQTPEEAEKSGEVIEVWEKDPSIEAAKVLLDRLLDKPSEHIELTGQDGGPLELVTRIASARKRLSGG